MKPKKKARPSVASRGEVGSRSEIEYIAKMLTQLKMISEKSGDQLLTYFIEMAEMYAIELQHQKKPINSQTRKEQGFNDLI